MGGMSKPRPPYLHKTVTRHGKIAWYVWKRPGKKIRLKDDYGAPGFMAAYQAALAGTPAPQKEAPQDGQLSLTWLIKEYRARSTEWKEYSADTKKQRENIFRHVAQSAGHLPYPSISKADIVKGIEKRHEKASAANNFLAAMRGLFEWAVSVNLVKFNPTAGIKNVKRPKTGGFHQWTEEEVQAFEARWPLGTRERLAMTLMLYTGARRGDAAQLGPQHEHQGELRFKTEKSGYMVPVTIPILPPLREALDASSLGRESFVASLRDGKPLAKESFGNWFHEACKAAGIDGNCHGLRKVAATRCAYAGASIPQLNAIFGWTGTQMAMHYTREAERMRLARAAATMLLGANAA